MSHLYFSTGLNIVSLQDILCPGSSLPITASGGTGLVCLHRPEAPIDLIEKNTTRVHIYWDPEHRQARVTAPAPLEQLIHKDKKQTDSRSDATSVLSKEMNSSSFLINHRNTQLY